MKLKFFENELIPEEIHEFYDDLALKYLKSDYTYGREEKGPIVKEKIGRYHLNKLEIYSLEPNIELGYLLYCEEGYQEQDRLVIYYDKYVLAKELKDIFEKYSGSIFEIINIPYIENNMNITDVKDKKNHIKVSPGGIIIASHIFGIRKVRQFFGKSANYCKNKIPISSYIDDKNYDVSFLTGLIKEKKVIPDIKKDDDIKIDIGDEFLGQKSDSLKKQIDKLLPLLEKLYKDKKALENLKKSENKSNQSILDEIKKLIKPNNGGKNNRIVDDDEKVRKILKEKFDKNYGDKKYSKYFEDTTNSKVDKKEKKAFNEVLRGADKDSKVVNQEGFDKYRSFIPKNLKTFDFIYDLCMKSVDPLQTLEDALCFLSCKYENENKLSHAKTIAKNIFKSKVADFVERKIEKFAKVEFPKDNVKYLLSLGMADVDEIRFDCKIMPLRDYPKTKYYRFLKLFKDENLVSKSYSLNKYGKRNFKRARRFLDNLLISMVKSMNRVESKFLDDFSNDRQNILRNYILYLDEINGGLTYEDYSFFNSFKPFNITNMFIALIKCNKTYKEKSLSKISELMQNKVYHEYTKNSEDEKIRKCFPTQKALEYNMRIRSSYDIYNFYKCIYKNDEKILNNKLVCAGASIKCSMSSANSKIIKNKSKKYIDGKPCLTIEDKNILPFKMCKINKICTPKLLMWDKKTDVQIDGKFALMSNAKCMCSLGGIISVENANQDSSNFNIQDSLDTKLMYSLDDYETIDKVYMFIEKTYFSRFSKYMYRFIPNILNIDRVCDNFFRKKLYPKYDEKNLVSNTCIPAVDNDIEAIVNVKPLSKILMGYFLGKINNKNFSDKWINIGKNLSCEIKFERFIKKAKKYLPIEFKPYKKSFNSNVEPIWMAKAIDEYSKAYCGHDLNERVILYHRLGGGINADIRTPWCASFVNFVINNGFKSPSSQSFYSKEGKKFFKKIKKAKYGAILVLKYNSNRGHCTFITGEDDRGYYCLGGNQSNRVKKAYFLKNDKIQGIYWPV